MIRFTIECDCCHAHTERDEQELVLYGGLVSFCKKCCAILTVSEAMAKAKELYAAITRRTSANRRVKIYEQRRN